MNRLPVEIQNYIYELAIKSYFKENIEPRIWYKSWENWRRTILHNRREYAGYKNKLDFVIDYFFHARGIYEHCEQKLFHLRVPSCWGSKQESRPMAENYSVFLDGTPWQRRDALYINIVNYGGDAAALVVEFRGAIFTHAEYMSFFDGSNNERAYIDVAENEHYKLCYISNNI